MGRNKSNGTPKDAPPSPRRTPIPTPPPPRSTNETKGRSRKNPVATRNKNNNIDMYMRTDIESTTVAPTVKNADKKRLSSGDKSSSTPGKSRKRNADVVDEDPLFATKRQRKTQTIASEQRRVRSNNPVQGGVAYTNPNLVVTEKHNDAPEAAIRSQKEGPDEGKESTIISYSGPSTGVNRSDATPGGDGLDFELRERSNEVLIKIAIMVAISVDEATAITKSSKPPPGPTVIKAKSSDLIVKSTKPVKSHITTATSTIATEPMVGVTAATAAVESFDKTAQGTAKDVDVYGSARNPIIIDAYGSASNPILVDDHIDTVDNTLATKSTTTDANLHKGGNPILIALGENTRLSLFRTFGPVALIGWLPLPYQDLVLETPVVRRQQQGNRRRSRYHHRQQQHQRQHHLRENQQ